MNDNSRCNDFQEALDQEIRAFEHYVRNADQESRDTYRVACVRTERCLWSLPSEYRRIGKERSARTWNIRNAYEGYKVYRDDVAEGNKTGSEFVDELYYVYKMQEYLQGYTGRLVQITMAEGTEEYQKEAAMFSNIPYIIVAISIALMIIAIWLTKILSNSVAKPIVSLAASTRKIAANDFDEPDLIIENKDEMGELVTAFNVMKHSTKGYIATMKENNKMQELLHKEELERSEMEKQLGSARLELLKSQINPHFLFNTLNMIACTAKLEDAVDTEKMILSLGNLFRYNLKTREQTVTLDRELKIVNDYMYLQKMRFGSRIKYRLSLETDAADVIIPSLSLQPLVENAVVHGLSKKETGGILHIRIWKKDRMLILSVADTGLGMSQERCEEVAAAMKEHRTAKIGIGLGNIYKRVHMMYQKGDLRIYSREGKGTVIQLMIPQGEETQGKKYMYRLLIADDEMIERKVLFKTLSQNLKGQCEIFQAENGREALEIYEKEKIQIAILDIEMPGINGIQAAERIREKDKNAVLSFLQLLMNLPMPRRRSQSGR